MLLVCEATRRHVTVALVGDGGDEGFGGYERYRAHALAGRIPRARPRLRRRGARRVAGGPADAALDALPRPPLPRRRRAAAGRTLRPARRGLPARAPPRASGRTRRARRRPRRCCPHDPDLRLVDIESYLPGDLLPKSDIASMAVSLELRSPFLDHHVDRARARAAARARLGQDGPQAGVRRRPAAGDAARREDRLRRPARLAGSGASSPARRPSCCSAAPTAACSGAPSSSGSCASTPSGAPTTATGSGASACSSSGSGATSTPARPCARPPERRRSPRRGPA